MKNSLGKSIKLLAFSAALCGAVPVSAKLIGVTEEFEDGPTRPVTIALLPARASMSEQRLVRQESLIEESTEFSGVFSANLEELLSAQGYVVDVIDPERVASDPRLQELVIDANRRYEEMVTGLKFRRVKRRIYNAGDEARLLANYLDVDAVAFPRLDIVAATGGKKAMSILIGGSMGGSVGTLAVVDRVSGDLEAWFTGVGGAGRKKFEEDPEAEILEIAQKMMKDLPDADPTARINRSVSEEDVLSELESLLEE